MASKLVKWLGVRTVGTETFLHTSSGRGQGRQVPAGHPDHCAGYRLREYRNDLGYGVGEGRDSARRHPQGSEDAGAQGPSRLAEGSGSRRRGSRKGGHQGRAGPRRSGCGA